MKKLRFILALLVVFLIPMAAIAIDVPRTINHSFIDTITISADGTASLPAYWKGWYLVQVKVTASTDDAVTFTINQAGGGRWGTKTTTAATDGEYVPSDAPSAECRYITGTPTYTLADMSGGTLTVEAVLVQ
jgi:hypothetical protein